MLLRLGKRRFEQPVLLKFRPADPRDWDAIAAHLEGTGLPLNGAREHLEHFTLAFDGERLVGTAGLEVYGDAALLRSVAVRPESRAGAVGTRLVRHCLETARGLGVKDVVLLTETAADYFPRFGFTIIPRNDAPDAVKASAEFRGTCLDSATTMHLPLEPR
jgi:amino-acid N-acetyltransferase